MSRWALSCGLLAIIACDRGTSRPIDGGETPRCEPASVRCSQGVQQRCDAEGAWQVLRDCVAEGLVCEAAACACRSEGERLCNGSSVRACTQGAWSVIETCEGDAPACVGGACASCEPEAARCGSSGRPERCDEAGAWVAQAACDAGTRCEQGACAEVPPARDAVVFASDMDDLDGWSLRGDTADCLYVEGGVAWFETVPTWPHAAIYRTPSAGPLADARVAVRFRFGGAYGEVTVYARLSVDEGREPARFYGYALTVTAWDRALHIDWMGADSRAEVAVSPGERDNPLETDRDYLLLFEVRGTDPPSFAARLTHAEAPDEVVQELTAVDRGTDGELPIETPGGFGVVVGRDEYEGRTGIDRVFVEALASGAAVPPDRARPVLFDAVRRAGEDALELQWREERSLPLAGEPAAGLTLEDATGAAFAISRATWIGSTRARVWLEEPVGDATELRVRYDMASGAVRDGAGNLAADAAALPVRLLEAPRLSSASLVGPGLIEAEIAGGVLPLRVPWRGGGPHTRGGNGLALSIGDGQIPITFTAPARRRPTRLRALFDPEAALGDGALQLAYRPPFPAESPGITDRLGTLLAAGSVEVLAAPPDFDEGFDTASALDGWRGATALYTVAEGALSAPAAPGAAEVFATRLLFAPETGVTDDFADGTLRVDFSFAPGDAASLRAAALCARIAGRPEGATALCAGVYELEPGEPAFQVFLLRAGARDVDLAGGALAGLGYALLDGARHTLELQLDGDLIRANLYLPSEAADAPGAGETVAGRWRLPLAPGLYLEAEELVPPDQRGPVAITRGARAVTFDDLHVSRNPCDHASGSEPSLPPGQCP